MQNPPQGSWDKILNSDKAGAATNAEDFTKQFMSQMYSPQVTPVGQMPSGPTNPGQTFTKTSLAANKQVWYQICLNFVCMFVNLFVLNVCLCTETTTHFTQTKS